MATSVVPAKLSGGINLKARDCSLPKSNVCGKTLMMQRKSNQQRTNRNLSVRAEYDDHRGGADFLAGFLVGGALFGTLAYTYAPQLRRVLLNEDEHGFRKARRPMYEEYDDEGILEGTRHNLNAKIQQLNNAIDNVATRLRGGRKMPPIPETKPEEFYGV